VEILQAPARCTAPAEGGRGHRSTQTSVASKPASRNSHRSAVPRPRAGTAALAGRGDEPPGRPGHPQEQVAEGDCLDPGRLGREFSRHPHVVDLLTVMDQHLDERDPRLGLPCGSSRRRRASNPLVGLGHGRSAPLPRAVGGEASEDEHRVLATAQKARALSRALQARRLHRDTATPGLESIVCPLTKPRVCGGGGQRPGAARTALLRGDVHSAQNGRPVASSASQLWTAPIALTSPPLHRRGLCAQRLSIASGTRRTPLLTSCTCA
jgi:hypothetical protein